MNVEQLMMRNLPFRVVGVRHSSFASRFGIVFVGMFGRFSRFGRFSMFSMFGRFGRFGRFSLVRFGRFGWFGRFGRFGRFGFTTLFVGCSSLQLMEAIMNMKRHGLHIFLGPSSMRVIKL